MEIAKSVGFNSPQLAAIGLNLSLIDIPWLAAGEFIESPFKEYLYLNYFMNRIC